LLTELELELQTEEWEIRAKKGTDREADN